jgi:lysophospholipase L1-like esterase
VKKVFIVGLICLFFSSFIRGYQCGIVFGDSLAAGWPGCTGQTSPPTVSGDGTISYVLSQRTGIYWLNMGINGNTTQDLLSRINDVLAYNPIAVVVVIGSNDVKPARNISDSEFKANMITIVSALTAIGAKVYVLNIPPTNNQTVDLNRILETNDWEKGTLVGYGIENIDFYGWQEDPNNPGHPDPANLNPGDNVHLNPQAYNRLGEFCYSQGFLK